MKKLFRAVLRAAVEAMKPYRVVVKGRDFDGHVHRAWTYADALDWAKCYPAALCLEVHFTMRSGRWLGRVI